MPCIRRKVSCGGCESFSTRSQRSSPRRSSMHRLIAHLTGVLLLLLPLVAHALPTATPEEVGLSRERLARIAPALSRQIEAKSFPGAVAIVARKGRAAYFEAIGQLDPKTGTPMCKDAIFRPSPMTKPFAPRPRLSLVD